MKPISKLNNQQLLEIVDKVEDREKITEKSNDVGFFISHYNIRRGNHLVGIPLLYRLYRTWAKTPVKPALFKRELSYYLKIHQVKYVHISLHALNITKETYRWLLKKEEVTVESKIAKYIEAFLAYYNIVSGTCWVSHVHLYKVARHFCTVNYKTDPNMRTGEFVNYLKLHLTYQFTDKHMFRINDVGLMAINDEVRRIKELDEKKKSKRKNKIPGLKAPFELKNQI